MSDLSAIKARTTPVGKIHGVIEYLEEKEASAVNSSSVTVEPIAGVSGTNVQEVLAELASRIAALEP